FRISKTDMIKVMQQFPQVLENMLIMVSEKAQFLSGRIHFLTLKTIKEKIAAYIISRLRPNTISLELDKNQGELAEYFGVTRPALARALKQLEDEKLIGVKGRTIQVFNREGLLRLSM
ncbi:MAG TPA: Crp/Fnr family transcriptional regulator, partial [Bacteroidales bacterium]|nr:Crp/Fnr family transcriptional regulator [Bacteroidales bacterium]